MSAETFVNALFLITAVVAAGILITAVLPIIWNMAGTFSTASHESDTRMRTDFKIVTTYASKTTHLAKIWMKNIGSNNIGEEDITSTDVFFGPVDSFKRFSLTPTHGGAIPTGDWDYTLVDNNGYWDKGETLEITIYDEENLIPASTNTNWYFQFVLSNGVWRSTEFSTT
jgi:flagellar protein FlaG